MRLRSSLLPLLGLGFALWTTPEAQAQSIVAGSLSGALTDPVGMPVSQAAVALRSVDLGLVREVGSNAAGGFAFDFVTPGTYEVRVEALGFKPLVALRVAIDAGKLTSLRLVLEPSPPPVTEVDSVVVGGTAASGWRAGGLRFGPTAVGRFPDRARQLHALAALSPAFDDALGAQGLPGMHSVVVADGVPFFRAVHPARRDDPLGPALFPRSAFSSLTALTNAPDVEWGGAAGSFLSLTSGPSSGQERFSVDGSWSGDPLWSSSELAFDAPSLMSGWGSASASVEIAPDSSHLFVTGEGFQLQAPLAPRVDAETAGALVGLDADVLGALTSVPVETTTRVSGLARLDWWLGPSRRFMMRAAAGRLTRTFDGPGPAPIAGGPAGPEESTDFSVVGGLTSETDRGVAFEFRGGISGSSRVFDAAVAGSPSGMLLRTATRVGSAMAGEAEVTRVDFHASPIIHYRTGTGVAKAGAVMRLTRHTIAHNPFGGGAYFFDDAAALAGRRGAYVAAASPESSFGVNEIGGFAQYDWEAAPGLRLTFGARVDLERIPDTEVARDDDWLEASGLPNQLYPAEFVQVGGGSSLTWDVGGSGSTLVLATASVHQGEMDPAVLHELFSLDGATRVSRFGGAGVAWPGGSVPGGTSTRPALAILGPDSRPPQSSRFSAGLVQRVAEGWSLHVGGSFRRTDFLPRRRNLNLPVLPYAVDAHGRDVFGELRKDGALITAVEGGNRRFGDYDDVWALDSDGFSEYRGVTVGLEHASDRGELFAAYTRSTTEDNWVGAAAAHPWAELGPSLPEGRDAWSEGVSDFDVPERLVIGGSLDLGLPNGGSLSAVYRRESGLPFTPGYRPGVDANGDGSGFNDVAFVPEAGQLGGLAQAWPCLTDMSGGFAVRNGCRGPTRQSLDAAVRLGIARFGARTLELTVEGLDLIEPEGGLLDTSLLLVDPAGSLGVAGGTATVPVVTNPDFGQVLLPASRGRMLRVGFRIGG